MQHLFSRIEAAATPRNLWRYHGLVCVLILVFSCIGSVSLGKDGNWDLLNYHFYNPAALLTGRLGFDFFPAQRQNWLNPLMDIPTYLMITHFSPVMVGALMGLWHGLNLIFGYFIALRVFFFLSPATSTLIATLATVLAGTGSLVRGIWGTFTGDLTVSIFVVAALTMFLAALTAPTGKTRMRYLLLSGLIMGAGTGLRATVAVHAIPLLGLSVLLGSTLSTRLRAFISYGAACAVGFAATYGYWALILQSRYSSPFFPYYNAIFRSPLIAPVSLVDLRWMPTSLISHLMLPFTYLTGPGQGDVNFRDWRPGIAYAALIVLGLSLLVRMVLRRYAGLLAWHKAKPTVVLILFTVVSWAIWQVQFSYYRYLAPLEIIFPVLILSIIYLLISRPSVLVLASVVLFGVLMRKTTPMYYPRAAWGDSYFEISIPADLHLENAQVIIVDGDRPLGFLVPSFPATTQVLRLTSNLDAGLQDDAYSGLRNQRDQAVQATLPKFVMYGKNVQLYGGNLQAKDLIEIDNVLARYGLRRESSSCETITSRFIDATICPLRVE